MSKKIKDERRITAIDAELKDEFASLDSSLVDRLDIAITYSLGLTAALHEFRSNFKRQLMPSVEPLANAMTSLLHVGDVLYDIADFKFELDDGNKFQVVRKGAKKGKKR
jgi:hypothetical protein